MSGIMTARLAWPSIIDTAREIVESYNTRVTLRQLFYRLVAAQVIPNTQGAYKRLSELTAEARRRGTFPELTDRTRSIHEYLTYISPQDAVRDTVRVYRRDRTEDQDVSLYLAVEKAGIVNQLDAWFGEPFGLPILALGGYASQSYVGDVVRHVDDQGRPAVLLYGGDHDASGWDIPRDFAERTGCWKAVHRVALTPEQVDEYELPEAFGKDTDSRRTGFVERFGSNVQVELDALPPDVLRDLYQTEIDRYWDTSAYEAALVREQAERAALRDVADRFDPGAV